MLTGPSDAHVAFALAQYGGFTGDSPADPDPKNPPISQHNIWVMSFWEHRRDTCGDLLGRLDQP